MNKKRTISKEDKNLFRSVVGDSQPLKPQNRIHHKTTKKQRVVKSEDFDDEREELYGVSDFIDPSQYCTSNQQLSFKTDGVQLRQFQKLKKGQIMIEEILDLHGLTVDQARKQVDLFITDCISCDFRCVIIIHGKSGRDKPPVIKTMINHWLRQIDDVIAFVSALPADGGTGAVYTLLRKTRLKNND